jgi:hypothetical protein
MICILLIFLLFSVKAEWPPKNCRRASTGVSVVLTDQRNKNSVCELTEEFGDNIYIQFKRVYTKQPTEGSDSTMGMAFNFDGHERFTLEIHNDRLLVKPGENMKRDITVKKQECLAVLARKDSSINHWARIRINHLQELKRTFISVDLTSYEGTSFISCVRFEMPIISTVFKLKLFGFTLSGMRQEVSMVTNEVPSLVPVKDNKIVNRLDRLEKKVTRIQNALHMYMGTVDEHVSQTANNHMKLEKKVTGTKNKLESRTTSHLLVWIFVFALTGILICGFISWKFKNERRHHYL